MLLCQWIMTVWHHISTQVTVKAFKKYCVSIVVDGYHSDTPWDDNDEADDGSSKCTEEGSTD
jgi:hypothetical protein